MDGFIESLARRAIESADRATLEEMRKILEEGIACNEQWKAKYEEEVETARQKLDSAKAGLQMAQDPLDDYGILMREIVEALNGTAKPKASKSKKGKRKAKGDAPPAEDGAASGPRRTRITKQKIRKAIIEYLDAWPHPAHLEDQIRREIAAATPGMAGLATKEEAFGKALATLVSEGVVQEITRDDALPLYAHADAVLIDPEGEDDQDADDADEKVAAEDSAGDTNDDVEADTADDRGEVFGDEPAREASS